MDNFKFRLQKVLDIRVKNEDESKVKYSKAQSEKRAVEKELEDLKLSYQKYSDTIDIEDGVGRSIVSNYLSFVSNMIEKTDNELKEKEVLVNEARLELLNNQIERKSIEKLKENKYKLHKKEVDQKEQAINDEFGIYSYFRNVVQSI
ncbi:flagellar export protein FliJ [Clostridium culturomicium]|uniref:flagellar export protein FliJ n=1 Tax=Clostridium culturomicium TaxID=1499683 RepID=UPI00058BE9B8|nr:flagellar export protein FliJ [Clostridium culturomicium]